MYIEKGWGVSEAYVSERKLEEVVEEVSASYPDDMGFEIGVCDASTSLTVLTCEQGTRISLSDDLCLLPKEVLVSMIEATIDAAAHDETPVFDDSVRFWMSEKLWELVDRPITPYDVVKYSKMPQMELDALRILKDSGLLDDLPKGTVYRAGAIGSSNIPHRIVRIPVVEIKEGMTRVSLAKQLYRDCFLDLIVNHAIMNGLNMPEDPLKTEMMSYSESVIVEE